MSISIYEQSGGFVTAEQWSSLIAEHRYEISEADTMASWFAGTSRMSDTTTLNVVIYEDGEVRILCKDKCEQYTYDILDDDYFKNHRAFYCVSSYASYNPVDEEVLLCYCEDFKKEVYDLVEKTHKEKELNEMVKEMYEDYEYESYKELDGYELMALLKNCEELYDLFCDYQALYGSDNYDYTEYYDSICDMLEEDDYCDNETGIDNSAGIAHNKYMFYDGLHDYVVEEYNKFTGIM